MSIRVGHDPSLTLLGAAAYGAGWGQWQKWLSEYKQKQYMQTQHLQAQADMQQAQIRAQQAMEQVRLNSQAAMQSRQLESNERIHDSQLAAYSDRYNQWPNTLGGYLSRSQNPYPSALPSSDAPSGKAEPTDALGTLLGSLEGATTSSADDTIYDLDLDDLGNLPVIIEAPTTNDTDYNCSDTSGGYYDYGDYGDYSGYC